MKKLTLQAVQNSTVLLMEASPRLETTTLEVKTLLRYLGFEAVQAEVSELMSIVREAEGLYTRVDGVYKIYSFAPFVTELSAVESFKFR